MRLATLYEMGRNLEKDFVVAIKPDHPFLIDGPDLLIGYRGKLAAIFVPRLVEIKERDRLLVRLTLSRLALPSHLQTILLIDAADVSNEFVHATDYNFEKTLDISEYLRVGTFLENSSRNEHKSKDIQNMQSKAFSRFRILYQSSLARSVTAQNRQTIQAETYEQFSALQQKMSAGAYNVPRWGDSKGLVTMYRLKDYYLSFVSGAKIRKLKDSLIKACLASTELSYNLDNGIPYHKQDSLSIMVTDRIITYRSDPRKYIRSMAFAGWFITTPAPEAEITEMSDRIQTELRQKP